VTDLIRPQGTIVTIVENKQPLKQDQLKLKSASLAWEFMFTRAMFQTEDMHKQGQLLNQIAAWIDDGILKSTLNQTLSPINAANLRDAHRSLEAGESIGKIVLIDWTQ
jgi:NADPH:quinone reductase